MDIPVVHPSPILRQTLLERFRNGGESPKKVQFENGEENIEMKEKSPEKKGKPRRSYRDSMKIRYRTGKPGSRRYQRWSNEVYLGYDWSDVSESEVEEDIFETFQEIHERPHFSFTKSFNENSETLEEFWYSAQWDDVLSTSVDISSPMPTQTDKSFANSESRFRTIPRKSRIHLEKYSTTRFVADLEEELHNYIKFLTNPLDSTRLNNSYQSPSKSFNASMQNGALVIYFQVNLIPLKNRRFQRVDDYEWFERI